MGCPIGIRTADKVNGNFKDGFTKTKHNQVPLLNRSAQFMEKISIIKQGVTKLLKGLTPCKTLELD